MTDSCDHEALRQEVARMLAEAEADKAAALQRLREALERAMPPSKRKRRKA